MIHFVENAEWVIESVEGRAGAVAVLTHNASLHSARKPRNISTSSALHSCGTFVSSHGLVWESEKMFKAWRRKLVLERIIIDLIQWLFPHFWFLNHPNVKRRYSDRNAANYLEPIGSGDGYAENLLEHNAPLPNYRIGICVINSRARFCELGWVNYTTMSQRPGAILRKHFSSVIH